MDLKTGLDFPDCHSISGTPEYIQQVPKTESDFLPSAGNFFILALPTFVTCLMG